MFEIIVILLLILILLGVLNRQLTMKLVKGFWKLLVAGLGVVVLGLVYEELTRLGWMTPSRSETFFFGGIFFLIIMLSSWEKDLKLLAADLGMVVLWLVAGLGVIMLWLVYEQLARLGWMTPSRSEGFIGVGVFVLLMVLTTVLEHLPPPGTLAGMIGRSVAMALCGGPLVFFMIIIMLLLVWGAVSWSMGWPLEPDKHTSIIIASLGGALTVLGGAPFIVSKFVEWRRAALDRVRVAVPAAHSDE